MINTSIAKNTRKLKRGIIERVLTSMRNEISVSAKVNKNLRDFEITEENRILERRIIKRLENLIKIATRARLKLKVINHIVLSAILDINLERSKKRRWYELRQRI